MDWTETTEPADATAVHSGQAFSVLQEVPSTFTSRTQKTALKAKSAQLEAQEGACTVGLLYVAAWSPPPNS